MSTLYFQHVYIIHLFLVTLHPGTFKEKIMALMKTENRTETRLQPWPVMQDHLTSKTVIVVGRGIINLPRISSILDMAIPQE